MYVIYVRISSENLSSDMELSSAKDCADIWSGSMGTFSNRGFAPRVGLLVSMYILYIRMYILYIRMYVCVNIDSVYMYVCMYVCIYMYVYICMYVCILIKVKRHDSKRSLSVLNFVTIR